MILNRLAYLTLSLSMFFPHIALSSADPVDAPPVDAADADQASEVFLSDGAEVKLEDLGIAVTPPEGWQVKVNDSRLSVILSQPKDKKIDYVNAKYQRNITIAAIHKPSPIDQKRANELKQQLIKAFSKEAVVEDFQVIEHKFFNFRKENDGLIVYSTFKVREYPMMQMHVLVSGEHKQFLLTYTDLTERFSESKEFEIAWNAMTSLKVVGDAPMRLDRVIMVAAVLGFLAVLLGVVANAKRRRKKYDFTNFEEDIVLEDGDDDRLLATLHGEWHLSQYGKKISDDVFDYDFEEQVDAVAGECYLKPSEITLASRF